jgi:uncharacterized protein
MPPEPTFDVVVPEEYEPDETLLIGFANVGMTGVTAVDYLVRNLDSEEIGHVATRDLPDIVPFSNGEPRYPMRLYDLPGTDFTALISELFVPVWAAEALADGVVEWTADSDVREVAVLHGVPFPHGPDEHAVFHVSDPAFRSRRLEGTDVRPLGGGVFDGFVGELVTRSLDGELPPLGALVTPIHPPGPDLDAALRLLDSLQSLYGFEVSDEELRTLSEELKRHYSELTDRMRAIDEGDRSLAAQEYPEDRMFM